MLHKGPCGCVLACSVRFFHAAIHCLTLLDHRLITTTPLPPPTYSPGCFLCLHRPLLRRFTLLLAHPRSWPPPRQVRLNLLPTLLEEAGAHLHSCLCASALGRRIFVQPFHRDVVVTPALLAAMHSSLQLCRQVRVLKFSC